MPEPLEPIDHALVLSIRDRQNRLEQLLHEILDRLKLIAWRDGKTKQFRVGAKKGHTLKDIRREALSLVEDTLRPK